MSAELQDMEPDEVHSFLVGKTISALYVHKDGWLALDFTDGSQAELSAVGGYAGEASLYVESGTRIRDIYKVSAA